MEKEHSYLESALPCRSKKRKLSCVIFQTCQIQIGKYKDKKLISGHAFPMHYIYWLYINRNKIYIDKLQFLSLITSQKECGYCFCEFVDSHLNMKQSISVALALMLTACGGGDIPISADSMICDKPTNGWIFCYGDPVTFDNGVFTFPSGSNGVSYVYKRAPSGMKLGQTVTLKFTLTGNGTFGVSDATDILPASANLFLWRAGDNLSCAGNYQQYRAYAAHTPINSPGTYTLTAPLNHANWIDCYGYSNETGFANLIANLAYVGFTFGGTYYYGHGAYAKTGTIQFTLNSFTVQ